MKGLLSLETSNLDVMLTKMQTGRRLHTFGALLTLLVPVLMGRVTAVATQNPREEHILSNGNGSFSEVDWVYQPSPLPRSILGPAPRKFPHAYCHGPGCKSCQRSSFSNCNLRYSPTTSAATESAATESMGLLPVRARHWRAGSGIWRRVAASGPASTCERACSE